MVCVVLTIGLTLLFTSQQVNEALVLYSTSNEIVESAFGLNMLTNEYFIHQEERIISQWHIKHDSLTIHLTELVFRNFDDQSILDKILQNNEDIKDIFFQLITSYEGQGTSGEASTFQEVLITQLSLTLQDIVSNASLLSEVAKERLLTASQTSNLLVIVFVVVIMVIIGANSVLLFNSIAKPITRLHEGVEKIARGNLDYKVGITSEDEIGQLSRAFDQMTEDLKARTEKLKEYSENLEKMVEERTRELRDIQEELLRKEKLAVLGQLAGGVGHELRNPLGVINNSSYFLNMRLKNVADEKVKKHLKIIEREVNSANTIISGLLDFASSKTPTKHQMDLNDVIQKALSQVAIPKNIRVVNQLDKTLPPIIANPTQLGQVFGNIILNAVQAMPEGGQLMIKSKAPNPEIVTVSISDTGVGIPEENLDKIFEPLFTTQAKGIGLGLAVTKTLVERHGGIITVESEVGKGSTFTVKLPSHMEEEVDGESTISVP